MTPAQLAATALRVYGAYFHKPDAVIPRKLDVRFLVGRVGPYPAVLIVPVRRRRTPT